MRDHNGVNAAYFGIEFELVAILVPKDSCLQSLGRWIHKGGWRQGMVSFPVTGDQRLGCWWRWWPPTHADGLVTTCITCRLMKVERSLASKISLGIPGYSRIFNVTQLDPQTFEVACPLKGSLNHTGIYTVVMYAHITLWIYIFICVYIYIFS